MGCNTYPLVALAHVELRAFARVGAEAFEHGAGGLDQREARAGRGAPADQTPTEPEASSAIAHHERVLLERDREAVRGRPR